VDSYLGEGARIVDHRRGVVLDRSTVLAAAGEQATVLADLGAGNGSRIALAHGEGAAFIADLLAIWSLGATALVVSPTMTSGERENVISWAEPAAWIGIRDGDIAGAVKPAEFDGAKQGGSFDPAFALDDVAVIMMTSGTTSQPKGVMLTHRAIQARLSLNRAHIGDADLAISLNVLPMHFGHGLIGNCLTPLFAGSTLVVWPEPGPAGLTKLGAVIDEHRISFMSSVPALWQVVLRLSEPPKNASLRRVHVGSAPLSAGLWQRIVAWCGIQRVVNMYGITECANWIGGESAETVSGDGELVDGLVGAPWGGAIRVIGPDGMAVDAGRGEIAVNSPSLMTSYFRMSAETAEVLNSGWLMTGDLGEVMSDGRLRLVGRRKHEINRGGIKVPAEEIDLLLERHADVAEACAFAVDDPLEGEQVAVAVVAHDDVTVAAQELIGWCEQRIRREAVPARVYVIEQLPRNARGKVRRDDVRLACLGIAAQSERK
jgi:acyl-CoA synthetase (AMP-forming)/AMP-acid ligase II